MSEGSSSTEPVENGNLSDNNNETAEQQGQQRSESCGVGPVFSVDRSKIIPSSSLVDQLPILAEIGVTAYDQRTFEDGILEQVDEAIRRSTTADSNSDSNSNLNSTNQKNETSVDANGGDSSEENVSTPSNATSSSFTAFLKPVDIIRSADFRKITTTDSSSPHKINREEEIDDVPLDEDEENNIEASASDYVPSSSDSCEEDEYVSVDDEEIPSTSFGSSAATTAAASKIARKGRKSTTTRKGGKSKISATTSHLKDDGNETYYKNRLKEWKTKQLHDRLVKAAQQQQQQSGDDSSSSSSNSLAELSEEVVELTGGLKIPTFLWDKLYPYQKTGVRWLWDLHCQSVGGIIGDEMGLGKTIQIIVFLAALDHSKLPCFSSSDRVGAGNVLIVCPTTVMHQWVGEFHVWWPPLRITVLHDSGSFTGSRASLLKRFFGGPAEQNGGGGVLITSFSTMTLERDLLLRYDWDYVILDEGHKIRNPDARVTVTAKQFRTPHRLILSGTPMQNSLKELWSLFDFVFPGRLGALPVFLREFGVPITQGGYANATEIQVRTAYRCACVLRDVISPYLLRRMKADVQQTVQLPSKNEQVLFCRLADEQRALYRQYLASRECESILKGSLEVFVGLIALRKLCNHPDLLTGGPNRLGDIDLEENPSSAYGFPGRCGKLTVVEALLKLWKSQGHRVLLFSQSKQMLDILERFVRDRQYTYFRMDGGTPIGSRQRLVTSYNEDSSIFLFLLTTRVGGLGLNLIGADRVLIYDPDWNPSTDAQARERVWRIGQERPVTIYRLLTTGTIEEKIYHRQIFKQFLTNRVLKDPRQKRFFKTNDLYELFTLTDEIGVGDQRNGVRTTTESGSLFAGTGSEIKKAPSKKRKRRRTVADCEDEREVEANSNNIFDQLAKERSSNHRETTKKRRKLEIIGEGDDQQRGKIIDEDDIDFVPESAKEESRQLLKLSDQRKTELRDLARNLSRRLINTPKNDDEIDNNDRNRRRKHTKDTMLDGVRIRCLEGRADYRPPGSGGDDQVGDDDKAESSSKHDDYVLRKLFKKSGIQSALRHDKIVNDTESDHILVEAEAENVAKRAAESLEASRRLVQSASDYGIVTWTGRQGDVGRTGGTGGRPRFGPKAKRRDLSGTVGGKSDRSSSATSITCGAPISTAAAAERPLFSGLKRTSAAADSSSLSSKDSLSSTELISVIRNRRSISDLPTSNGDNEGNRLLLPCAPRFQELMNELRLFLVLGGRNADGRATTKEILSKFGTRIPSQDSSVFRSMLKRICDFHREAGGDGVWALKPQYR